MPFWYSVGCARGFRPLVKLFALASENEHFSHVLLIPALTVSLTTSGYYLRVLGMSPQKPVRRVHERNDGVIAKWLSEKTSYPEIARQVWLDGATVYWDDETGLQSDHVACTSYAPLGQPPVIRATLQLQHDLGNHQPRGPYPSRSSAASFMVAPSSAFCGACSSKPQVMSI